MLVPRAYHYVASPLSRSPSPNKREKSAVSRASKLSPPTRNKSSSDRPTMPGRLGTVSPATPSKPVVIPTRTPSSKTRSIPRSQHTQSEDDEIRSHDRNALPPSVAALLAVTSIPRPKKLAMRKRGMGRHTAAESLTVEDFHRSPSTASPKSWSILQSSPDEFYDDDDSRTERSVDGVTDASSIMSGSAIVSTSIRSISSDSLPSLDVDFEGDSSQSFSPPSPKQRPRHRRRHDRQSLPAIPIASDSEHPLATTSFPDSEDSSPSPTSVVEDGTDEELFSPPRSDRSTSFKSNLTASLRLLRSAAKVLSSPTRLQDPNSFTLSSNYTLSSSASPVTAEPLLTPKSADFFLSNNIDALPLHLSAQLPGPPPTISIQLQACQASPLSTPTATAPPIFFSSSKKDHEEPELKPPRREPRENSDFLRVVVLEMNMRRAGKLSGAGRARIWLGAREDVSLSASASGKASIADGAKAQGAVFLDGELGEAQEVELEVEQQHHHHHPLAQRRLSQGAQPAKRSPRTPQRWVPITP